MSIQVTVGQVPGTVKDVTLDEVVTVAEAIRKAGFSNEGYEIRVNNVPTTNFNQNLEDEDIVSLVKNVKGNAGVQLLNISVTLPDKTTKRVYVAKGEFLISLKKTLALSEKFSDYIWNVNGTEQTDKQFEITKDCRVEIGLRNENTATDESTAEVSNEENKNNKIKGVKVMKKAKETVVENNETMVITLAMDGDEAEKTTVKKGMRCGELLKSIKGSDAKWADYIISKNGQPVKLGFIQLKDGDTIHIESRNENADEPSESANIVEGTDEPTLTVNTSVSTEAEPTEAEPTEAEPTETEPTEAEPTEAEPTETEPTEADCDCNDCCCGDTCKCENEQRGMDKDELELRRMFDNILAYLRAGYTLAEFRISTGRQTSTTEGNESKEDYEVYANVYLRKTE